MNLDRELARRHFLKQAFWLAGLSAFGVMPAACASKWRLLPPRPVDWQMKPLSSARVEERALADGRKELYIEHDLLRGVSPAMLVWFWRNIEGDIEVNGRTYPRYLIFHPGAQHRRSIPAAGGGHAIHLDDDDWLVELGGPQRVQSTDDRMAFPARAAAGLAQAQRRGNR